MGYLGQTALRPYPGNSVCVAGQRLHRVPLLCGAVSDEAEHHQQAAGMDHLLALECGCRPWRMEPGAGRIEPASRMGGVSAGHRRCHRVVSLPADPAVRLPFWKCGASELYVSGWYLLGGLTFTFLAYPVGNLLPHMLPGAMGAAFSGLWIHDAVGVFITPLATAISYFVIPAVTRKPIYSHFYSMIGFWLLFLVYPLNGIHHYVYSSLPMSAQHASEVASIYQGIDVIIVVTNLLLSIGLATEGLVARDHSSALCLDQRRALPDREHPGRKRGGDGLQQLHPLHRLGSSDTRIWR